MNQRTSKAPPVRAGRTAMAGPHGGGALAVLWRNAGGDPNALQEDSSCADFAAGLARLRSAYEQQAQVAAATGRPDLASSFRARAAADQFDLLAEWLSRRQPGHPSLPSLRAAARVEGHSRYSSRGRRAGRAGGAAAPSRQTEPDEST